jgi:hypothetical protein
VTGVERTKRRYIDALHFPAGQSQAGRMPSFSSTRPEPLLNVLEQIRMLSNLETETETAPDCPGGAARVAISHAALGDSSMRSPCATTRCPVEKAARLYSAPAHRGRHGSSPRWPTTLRQDI